MRTLVVVFLFAFVIFYFGQSKIEAIECQINQTPCLEEMEKEFEVFLGQNFFLFDPHQKIQALKATRPYWQKVEAKKIPFNKILISITTRQPVACLLSQNKIFLLDQEAVLLNEVAVNPGLPAIETETFQKEEITKALEAIRLLEEYGLIFERLIVENQGLTLIIAGIKALMPFEELSFKIASLQMILSQGKIEDELPLTIDLRFTKPVIRY